MIKYRIAEFITGPVWGFLYRISCKFDPICRKCGHAESEHEGWKETWPAQYHPFQRDYTPEQLAILDQSWRQFCKVKK